MSRVNSVTTNPVYRDDELIRSLVERYHTPLYVFDEATIRQNCRDLKSAIEYPNTRIRYACKALTLGAVLRIILSEGLWIDASSLNEVHRAICAGASPQQIYYTGEGATADVYAHLVSKGILINCTSLDQIRLLGRVGGTKCSIRVNPGEGNGETNKTNTGGPSSKHGIYYTELDEAIALASDNGTLINGIHSHIGSGTDLAAWLRIKDKTLALARRLPDLEIVNLGGGLPVVYDDQADDAMPLQAWGSALSKSMQQFSREFGREIELQIEPGRYVVASSGILLAQTQAVKSTAEEEAATGYNFVIVNTGLNHNIRPTLYGAYHPIRFVPLHGGPRDVARDYVVAGYLCESGDVFTVGRDGHTLKPRCLPEVQVGDLMVMAGVGAYSHSMKSEYNSMNLPASVLIDASGTPKVIERRGTIHDIMRRELEAYNEGVG